MSRKLTPWPDNGENRQVLFTPAYHRCNPDPNVNYGIGSVRMMWVLKHDGWAMTWDVHTDWGMPDEAFKAAAPDCTHIMHRDGYPSCGASGGAVDWHAPVPMYEGQERSQDECVWLGGPCYTDSGFMLGSELFDLLRVEGDEAVWSRLRELMDQQRTSVTIGTTEG